MTRYAARRLVLLIPVLVGLSVVIFAMTHLTPGDPVRVILGDEYDEERAAQVREQLGLDRPLPVQYLSWVRDVSRGDLGDSLFMRDPVLSLILDRLPLTIQLAASSMVIAIIVAIPLGTASAIRRNGVLDILGRITATIGIAVPVFWSGILLILIFGLELGWLPAGGSPDRFGYRALVLPSLALGLANASLLTRMTRASVVQVLGEQYVTTARAKGLHERTVYIRHALRNALSPILTVIGLEIGTLLGGAVLTERIFGLPGLGSLLVESIYRRDFPVIQGTVLLVALIFVVVNFLVDIAYALIDPRVRYSA